MPMYIGFVCSIKFVKTYDGSLNPIEASYIKQDHLNYRDGMLISTEKDKSHVDCPIFTFFTVQAKTKEDKMYNESMRQNDNGLCKYFNGKTTPNFFIAQLLKDLWQFEKENDLDDSWQIVVGCTNELEMQFLKVSCFLLVSLSLNMLKFSNYFFSFRRLVFLQQIF